MSHLLQGLTRYLGPEQLALLSEAVVGIAGAGGLGSNCAVALARSGIRRMIIADHDLVEASNLNRQVYLPEDIGRPKVEALKRHLLRLDPDLDVETRFATVNETNALALFTSCGIVVEALDQASAKAMLFGVLGGSGRFLAGACGLAGCGGPPMSRRHLNNAVVVGDFSTDLSPDTPPLAPRVLQAAAMQADAVLEHILNRAYRKPEQD